jgi:hypothetical protein
VSIERTFRAPPRVFTSDELIRRRRRRYGRQKEFGGKGPAG